MRTPVTSSDDAIVLATAVINSVFIPKGVIAPFSDEPTNDLESTEFALVKLPQERRVLFRGYRDIHWQQVPPWLSARDDPAVTNQL